MEHIEIIKYNVIRHSGSPHVYFTSNIAVVPGSNYDLVRTTPDCKGFYLLLSGIYKHKAPAASSCILADNFNENKSYWAALQQMINSSRPIDAKANKEAILKIVVYETTSTAEPSRITTQSDDKKPLGESEAYLAGISMGSAGTASGKHPTDVNAMGLDTLTEVRVGEAVISIDSLARLYLSHQNNGSSSNSNNNEPIEVDLTLQEFSHGPFSKGTIRLRISFHSKLTIEDRSDAYQEKGKDGELFVESVDREEISFDTPEIVDFVTELSKGHSTSTTSAEMVRAQNAYKAEEWKEMFLDNFKEVFVLAKEKPGDTPKECPPLLDLKGPLASCPAHLTSYQAPLMSIDGESSVLSASYYFQPVKRNFISSRFHESLLGNHIDNVCRHFGTTSERFAAETHAALSKSASRNEPELASPKLLANLRIFGYALGLFPAGFRYREDFSLTSDTKDEGLVDIDEDTSRNLFLGLNGEDCDGFDALVVALIYILFVGLPQPRKDYLNNDPLAMLMIKHLCKCGSGHKNPEKCIGSWNHPGLQACQRLLFHYTPVSVVGACVNEYPEDLRPSDLLQEQEDYRVKVPTLNNLNTLTDPVLLKELKKLFTPTKSFSNEIGHRWSLAIPSTQLIPALVRGQGREDISKTGFLAQSDKDFRDDIVRLFEEIKDSKTTLQPLLPVLLFEASKPTNVFSICGANVWVKDKKVQSDLAEIERRSRDLVSRTSNGIEGMFFDVDVWEPRGVVMANEGQTRFVVGDDNPANLPPGFNPHERRYSTFYKAVVSGDLPTFINLTCKQDIGICFVSDEDGYVGRDIEDIFGLRSHEYYDLICPLFRISEVTRKELEKLEEKQRRERIPSQLGAYSKENIQDPTWIEMKTEAKAEEASTGNWLDVFRRTFLTVNMNIISSEHLFELEELLKQKGENVLCSQFRLHPRAAVIRLYSFYVK